MAKWKKQSHMVYQCSYHIVWCPKYRFRILEGTVAKYVEEPIRAACDYAGSTTHRYFQGWVVAELPTEKGWGAKLR